MATKDEIALAMQEWKRAFDEQFAFWLKRDVLEFEGESFQKWMDLRDRENSAREDVDTLLDEFLK
jgi:hypothetical protein